MNVDSVPSLLIALPALAACGCLYAKPKRARSMTIAVHAITFALALFCALSLTVQGSPPYGQGLKSTVALWLWSGDISASFAWSFDPLSAVFVLLVSGSTGAAMHLDPALKAHELSAKTLALLNLFGASLLVTLLASDLLVFMAGWYSSSLCAYQLLGSTSPETHSTTAGTRLLAFQRLGDLALLLGLLTLVTYTGGDLSFAMVQRAVAWIPPEMLGAIGGCLLVSILIRCAHIPCHDWLRRVCLHQTSSTSTLVSIGIAATGVYVFIRLGVFMNATPDIGCISVIMGTLTAVAASLAASRQTDIRAVLAYLSIGQLGLILVRLSLNGWPAAIAHLIIYAIAFTCLRAGIEIIVRARRGDTRLRTMGGLYSQIPWTARSLALGCLGLSSLPLCSDFFSHQALNAAPITQSLARDEALTILVLAATSFAALALAYATWRLYTMAFVASPKQAPKLTHTPTEAFAPRLPLLIAGALSALAGALSVPADTGLPSLLSNWLAPSLTTGSELGAPGAMTGLGLNAALLVMGMSSAYLITRRQRSGTPPPTLAQRPTALLGFSSGVANWAATRFTHLCHRVARTKERTLIIVGLSLIASMSIALSGAGT